MNRKYAQYFFSIHGYTPIKRQGGSLSKGWRFLNPQIVWCCSWRESSEAHTQYLVTFEKAELNQTSHQAGAPGLATTMKEESFLTIQKIVNKGSPLFATFPRGRSCPKPYRSFLVLSMAASFLVSFVAGCSASCNCLILLADEILVWREEKANRRSTHEPRRN